MVQLFALLQVQQKAPPIAWQHDLEIHHGMAVFASMLKHSFWSVAAEHDQGYPW